MLMAGKRKVRRVVELSNFKPRREGDLKDWQLASGQI
jgi:hypothetical protein